MDKDKLND